MEKENTKCPECGWDWKKKLPMTKWHELSLDGYGDWEKISEHPAWVHLTFEWGETRSSRNIAIEADDWVKGHFYYRDWTDSGIPFLNLGDKYESRF
jgi:hypothetical protein